MYRTAFLRNSIILFFFIALSTYVAAQTAEDLGSETDPPTTAAANTNPPATTVASTTKKYSRAYGSSYSGTNYGSGYDGYYDNNYEVVGQDGIDPSKYGTDIGDFGPVYDDKKPMINQLDVWIYAADDWEQKNDKKNRKRPQSNNRKSNRNKNRNNDDDNDYDVSYNRPRSKRSYSRVRFPVKRISNYRKFPTGRFPPLISIFPWVPIFYDKLTYQTFIFSPTGGIYIIPPLINFFGQRFAVAQLIKWGYASLVSTGAPPPPNVDVAPLVQPPPPGGVVTTGVVGSPGAKPGPSYDSSNYRFNGGVKTNFPTFKPRYGQYLEEGGGDTYGNYGSSGKSNYGVDTNYGGTRNQQVYPQGGPQPRGGGYN